LFSKIYFDTESRRVKSEHWCYLFIRFTPKRIMLFFYREPQLLYHYYHYELNATCGQHRWPLTISSSSILDSAIDYVRLRRYWQGCRGKGLYIILKKKIMKTKRSAVCFFLPSKYFKSLSEITQITPCLVTIIYSILYYKRSNCTYISTSVFWFYSDLI